MNEIEIFENFDQFDKIIKKQKKAKRIYKTSINRKKMVFYLFVALIYFLLCVSLFVFIGAQFHYILAILGILFGTISFCITGKLFFNNLMKNKLKKYGDGKLINDYIKYFGNINEKNIDKVKSRINNTISDKEITIFYKILDVKTKAMNKYISKSKGVDERHKSISDFNKLDENYFLTIKYIVENCDIKDLEKINGEKVKKSIKIFNIDQQLELSTIINERVNGNEYKKQTIDYNLGITDKIKVKNKNIIDI